MTFVQTPSLAAKENMTKARELTMMDFLQSMLENVDLYGP